MASLEGVQTRYLLRTGVSQQTTTNTPIAMRLRYKKTGTVTSVTVSTGTSITFVSTASASEVYLFATYTTLATLIGAINATGNFEAKVIDALLSDATTGGNYQVNGAIAAGTDSNGIVVWDMLAATSVTKAVTACLTGNRDWDTGWFNAEKVGQHRVVLQEFVYYLTLGGAGAGLARIYLRRGTPGRTETQITGDLSVSATKTSLTFASGVGFLSGRDGDEIICRVQDGTSIAGTAGDFVRVNGYLE